MTFSSYEMEDAIVEDEAFWWKGAMNGATHQVFFSNPAPILVQQKPPT